jgi:hypothetical protein
MWMTQGLTASDAAPCQVNAFSWKETPRFGTKIGVLMIIKKDFDDMVIV